MALGEMSSSRKVFILGSGFSKALYNSMPTLTELSDQIGSDLNSDTSLENASLVKHYQDNIPAKVKRNFEHLLSLLSMSMPWKRPEYSYVEKGLFHHISRRLRAKLNFNIGEKNNELATCNINDLFSFIHFSRIPVISFNYDTIYEDLFCARQKRLEGHFRMGGLDVSYFIEKNVSDCEIICQNPTFWVRLNENFLDTAVANVFETKVREECSSMGLEYLGNQIIGEIKAQLASPQLLAPN